MSEESNILKINREGLPPAESNLRWKRYEVHS